MFLFKDAAGKPAPQKQRKHLSFNDDSDLSTSDWINEFVQKKDWIITVEDQYLSDNFNLYGLDQVVEGYKSIIKFLRGQFFEFPAEMSQSQILKETEKLYTLVHARYVLTYAGIKAVKKKYEKGVYGHCPRVACKRQNLLPIGSSPNFGESKIKTYCPKCREIYETKQNLDGAAFGPYFPHLFLQSLHYTMHASGDFYEDEEIPRPQMTYLGIPIEPDSPFAKLQEKSVVFD